MTNFARNLLSGVGVVVIPAMLMGAKTLYDDHTLNTQHRVAAQEVIGYIMDTRKDVCLIKAHLKGVQLPDCEIER
ncbi:TMhelix containing protein [Vibrio phage 249E41-1]|nr:TMhelix containing protein [Vibrio phage 249E41-1]CAH9011827.1 TMhelix containing protein [Vibrio phage 277E43-1]CAH9015898.1 TMhelix containing protein [Vibrio phage 193E37-1]